MSSACASITVDLDNEWAYLKTQGVAGWQEFPSFLPIAVPRILDALGREELRMTCFIVGKDAEQPRHHALLKGIAAEGHEIANHSYLHEPWLHLYSDSELRTDFDKSEQAIFNATGHVPKGFRGPGFSTSAAVRAQLRERGYLYDSSLFPTWLGPLARLYFQFASRLPAEEKKRRKGLYGSLRNAFSSLDPYEIEPGLMEVPVTTMPIARVPVHLSYLLFLARRSEALARAYWDLAVWLMRMTGTAPCLLLHPTDFLDASDAPAMSFFPAFSMPASRKLAVVRHALRSLKEHWAVQPVIDNCRLWRQSAADATDIQTKAVAAG